jgi:hypothetical protein
LISPPSQAAISFSEKRRFLAVFSLVLAAQKCEIEGAKAELSKQISVKPEGAQSKIVD